MLFFSSRFICPVYSFIMNFTLTFVKFNFKTPYTSHKTKIFNARLAYYSKNISTSKIEWPVAIANYKSYNI